MTVIENVPPYGAASLTLTLFGPMQVLVLGQPIPRMRSRASLWLLALLVLRAGRPVEREWLAETLWPDADPEKALARMRPVLSELRKALGSEGARLQSPNYHSLRLDLTGADVDVLAFDTAIKNQNIPGLERAAALYQGPLLEGCFEEWVPQERAEREQSCVQALQKLAKAALSRQDWDLATGYFRRAIQLDPWQDAMQRGLMEALAQSGDINAALQAYREFVRVLREDPKAAPDPQTSTLYRRLRDEVRRMAAVPLASVQNTTESNAPAAVVGHLPHPLTDLIGREGELLEVAAWLRRSRLVTLTGPGGIGKTRLALAAAAEAARDYPAGAWMVALEALSDGAQIPALIARVLGVKEEGGQPLLETLVQSLAARRLLLVLDNCEHLRAASVQLIGHLLRECPEVRVLATSREVLGITGEAAWAVPGLAVPAPSHLMEGSATLKRVLMGYEGVQLFVERAQAVQQGFAITRDNACAIGQVCTQLEGIPLAIELAAARVRAMTVAQMALRLDDHLSLLTGGDRAVPTRQRTLRTTLDWSYALLTVSEQLLLARLSVFASGWTLEAAEGICLGKGVAAGQILDLLTSLADKSFVLFDAADGGRYRLLEVVRQYAAERLTAGSDVEDIRVRHRDWFLHLAESAPDVLGPDSVRGRRLLEAEHDNLRAALAWCEADPEGGVPGLRLVNTLCYLWALRGHFAEARQCLERALAHPGAQADIPQRALALEWGVLMSERMLEYAASIKWATALLELQRRRGDQKGIGDGLRYLGDAYARSDVDVAKALYEEALAVHREAGDPSRIARGLGSLAYALLLRGEYAAAQPLYEQSLEFHRSTGNKAMIGVTLFHLGGVVHRQGRLAEARLILEEALTVLRDLGDPHLIMQVLPIAGENAFLLGDGTRAAELIRECLELARTFGNAQAAANGLDVMAILLARSAPEMATRLLAATAARRLQYGAAVTPTDREATVRLTDDLRRALGEARFDVCWSEGSALTWEQAAEYALEG